MCCSPHCLSAQVISTQLHLTPRCSTLLPSSLYSILLHSILLSSPLLFLNLFFSTPRCSTLLYSTLLAAMSRRPQGYLRGGRGRRLGRGATSPWPRRVAEADNRSSAFTARLRIADALPGQKYITAVNKKRGPTHVPGYISVALRGMGEGGGRGGWLGKEQGWGGGREMRGGGW